MHESPNEQKSTVRRTKQRRLSRQKNLLKYHIPNFWFTAQQRITTSFKIHFHVFHTSITVENECTSRRSLPFALLTFSLWEPLVRTVPWGEAGSVLATLFLHYLSSPQGHHKQTHAHSQNSFFQPNLHCKVTNQPRPNLISSTPAVLFWPLFLPFPLRPPSLPEADFLSTSIDPGCDVYVAWWNKPLHNRQTPLGTLKYYSSLHQFRGK